RSTTQEKGARELPRATGPEFAAEPQLTKIRGKEPDMYAVDFEYYRARSLADAQKLLGDHPGAKLLAGGHSLIPLLKLRIAAPPAVVDIGRVSELRGVTISGNTARIGALTTHAEIAASADLRRAAAALPEAGRLGRGR